MRAPACSNGGPSALIIKILIGSSMFVARSLMSKQSPETRSHSWLFSARRHPKSKTIRFRQRLFFQLRIQRLRRHDYEDKSRFANSSRHHRHTLSDSQHCPGCARALYDKIAVGEPTK